MDILRNKKGIYKELVRVIIITAAAGIYAFNMDSFVNTGGLYPGGFAGIAVLIQRIAAKYFNMELSYSIIYIPINLIPVYIGWKHIGKKFTIYTFYAIFMTSFFTDFFPYITITYDPVLIAIFGGILCGLSISLCLMVGASQGGTDFISIYFSEKKGVDVWNWIFAFNVIVLAIAGFLFGFDKAMYSIIFQYALTQVITLMYKRHQKQTFFIISDKMDEIYDAIRNDTHHDGTIFKGTGCYQGKEKKMMYSVLSSEETTIMMKRINEIDPAAFVNTIDTKQLNGNFYREPKE